jgi:hypothetical protein
MMPSLELPHWLMIAGTALVVAGFIGVLGSVGIQDSHPGLVVIQALDGPIRFD